MKTSISRSVLSRSSKIVEAGRGGTTASAVTRSTRGAGLRLQVRPFVDPRDARQQVIHLGLCGRGNARARLALRAGGNHAALLQHVFSHRQSYPRLLLVADQRQMRVEQVVRGIAAALL